MVETIDRYKYDGLDWDVENQKDQSGYDATAKLLKIVREEMDKVNPDMLLTFACSQRGGNMIAQTDIMDNVDWLNIMSYMYNVNQVGHYMTGGVTPLADIKTTLNTYFSGISKDKINVGIGWYGRSAIVDPNTGRILEKSTNEMALKYSDFLKNIFSVATKNVSLSTQKGYPWYENYEGTKLRRSFIHNQESYRELCVGIKNTGVGGICIWDFAKGLALQGDQQILQRYYVDIHNEVFIDQNLAVEDNHIANKISIYPNPTEGVLYVEKANGQVYSVFTPAGQQLKTGHVEAGEITLNELSSGVYFVRIKNTVLKIVKE
jgi:GH18 family chitinase